MNGARECPHGDDPQVCPPCNPTAAPRLAAGRVGPPFPSRFAGRCAGCEGIIDVGEPIRRVEWDADTVVYRHDDPVCLEVTV